MASTAEQGTGQGLSSLMKLLLNKTSTAFQLGKETLGSKYLDAYLGPG